MESSCVKEFITLQKYQRLIGISTGKINDDLTNKALNKSRESNTRSIQTTIWHNRETRQIQNYKPVILSFRSVYEKNPHLFSNISTNWEITTVDNLKIFTSK